MIKSYRDLEVFRLAQEVDDQIFEISKKFPKNEQFSLGDQIRRSAHSISASIAEGLWTESLYSRIQEIFSFCPGIVRRNQSSFRICTQKKVYFSRTA